MDLFRAAHGLSHDANLTSKLGSVRRRPPLALVPPRRYYQGMVTGNVLEREEYVEQAYFFRVFRERVATNMAAQEILERIHEEILSTTRLPFAIQFLATELKHSGLLSSGFSKLPHYFTPYQAFVIRQTETESVRFNIDTALLVLERQADYLAGQPTQPGLFVFQFEVLSRNKLGYDEGLASMMGDPFYDAAWLEHLGVVRRQVGMVDFADLVYLRSEFYLIEQRRHNPCRLSSGRRKGKSPRPTAAGIRSTFLPPCSGSSVIRRCRDPSRAMISAPASRLLLPRCASWKCASSSSRARCEGKLI
jgi:hypothetical protein